MAPKTIRWVLRSLTVVVVAVVAAALFGSVALRAEDSPQVKEHIAAARKLAGKEWAPVVDF